MSKDQSTDGNTETTETAAPAADQQKLDALFDAAVDHVADKPTVAFTEETGKAVAEQPRDGEGKFAKKPEGEDKPAGDDKADKPAGEAPKKGEEQAAATESADDIIAKLPPESQDAVRRIIGDATKRATEAETLAKRHTSQVAGYRKKLAEAEGALKTAKDAGDAAGAKKAEQAKAAANAELEELAKDYPNIAKALKNATDQIARETEERVRKEVGGEIAKLQQSIKPLVERGAREATAAEEAAIADKHPGWDKEVETPQFLEWFQKQPVEVQALAKGNAQAEISLFNLYRVEFPLETPEQKAAREADESQRTAADKVAVRRESQLRDAAGPSGKRSAAPAKTPNAEESKQAMFDAAVKKVASELHAS
jgi:hypothetical protein